MQEYENKHLEMLRSGLAECTVLLKKNGQFPLESAGELALYGNGARHTVKGGTGSGEVNSRFFVTIEEARNSGLPDHHRALAGCIRQDHGGNQAGFPQRDP